MDRERLYTLMHKQICNCLPGKSFQRAAIEALRRLLFPVELEDRHISLEALEANGKVQSTALCDAKFVPATRPYSIQEHFPQRLYEPARTYRPLQAYLLENGFCFRSFALDDQRRFIMEATVESLWGNRLRKNKSIRAGRARRIAGKVISLATSHTDNYYHWFADIIGRLLLLPDRNDAFFYSDTRYPYQLETFKILGIPMSRVIPMTDYGLLNCEQLIVLGHVESAHPDVLRKLQTFARNLSAATKGASRRLYISRDDTRSRRGLLNEQELLPILREFNFERVLFSGEPVLKQIQMVQEAEYIIFPQGAAVMQMAFSRPETRFLELYSPLAPDKTGVRISTALGLEHHVLEGSVTAKAGNSNSPFIIDPQLLRKALDMLTAQAENY